MLHTLLNSGRITQYKYIAQDGFAIYEKAKSFRDALVKAKEVGPDYVKHLAVPSYDSLDGHIDWYTPNESKSENGEYQIVKWSAASDDEKREAFAKLKRLEDVLKVYGRRLISRGVSGDMLVLAHFLTGNQKGNILPAIHFPNQDCVFIVDGEPVITFWGFIENSDNIDISPLSRLSMPSRRSGISQSNGASGTGSASGRATSSAQQSTAAEQHGIKSCILSHLRCLLFLLLLLLLLPLLLWLLSKFFNFNLPFFNASMPSMPSVDAPLNNSNTQDLGGTGSGMSIDANLPNVTLPDVNLSNVTLPDVNLPNVTLPDVNMSGVNLGDLDAPVGNIVSEKDLSESNPLDELTAGVTKPQFPELSGPQVSDGTANSANSGLTDAQNSVDGIADNISDNKISDNVGQDMAVSNVNPLAGSTGSLSIDPAAIQRGDMSALNGHWQTKSGLMDSNSGKPLNLSYDHKGENGKLTITRQDGVKCVVSSKAGNDNGSVAITPAGDAVCKDNITYQMPQIKCTRLNDGSTKCFGQYAGQSPFPIRIFRN